METGACKMRGTLTFAVVVLLCGFAQSRSVQVELRSLIKNAALSMSSKGVNEFVHYTRANEKSGEAGETKSNVKSKVGFILFGDLEDLEKYRIEVNKNVENNQQSSEKLSFSPYGIKENSKNLFLSPVVSEEIENNDNSRSNLLTVEKDEKQNKVLLKVEKNLEEDGDTEDYEKLYETVGKGKTAVEIFSEDQYDDYNDKDNAAEEEISSEEDESEEERYYDEDEKYYEDENNKFNIPKDDRDDSYFDGTFMEDD